MNYLIYGNSYKLIDDKLKEIIKSKEVNTYYMEDIDINQIIDDISYTSLFDNEKTIIVKNVEILFNNTKKNIDKLNKLKNYLENPNDTSTLILISNEKINERTKINKEILSYLNIIQTPIYTKTYELTNNINKILKDYGYTINQIDLETLINKCLNNYDIIINEITKLKEIKKPGIITNKDIEDIISNYNINDIFGFKDAVLNKECQKALDMLDDLNYAKVDALPLVVMLGKEYSTLYDIKYLTTKNFTNEQISKELDNMHPFRVKTLRLISNKYDLDEIKNKILYLANLDMKLISQDNLGLDELRKFIVEL